MELTQKETSPFKNAGMKFSSNFDSNVYVLAFDKRLSYLRKGNDITSGDVRNAYEDYDGENNYLTIDLDLNSDWHRCTEKEIDEIQKGRLATAQHSDSGDTAVLVGDDDDDFGKPPSQITANDNSGNQIDRVRNEFPESWIFESFKIEGGKMAKKKMRVPDSITTWIISAFAVSGETAIAIAEPKELTVKMNFFIKINLPYSIRYKEILKVDVLVYNYVKGSKKLMVNVMLKNLNKKKSNSKSETKEFEFIDKTTCSPSKEDFQSKDIQVQEGYIQKASFYIRSNPEDTENDIQKKILLQVHATATDVNNNKYKDAVGKYLLVEQAGILEHQFETSVFKLNGGSNQTTFGGIYIFNNYWGSYFNYVAIGV
jgi:hypothetical protein